MNHHQFDDDDKDEDERKKINLWKVSWLWFCDADGEKSDLKTSKLKSMYRKKQKLTHLLTKLIRKGIYPRIEKGIINQDLKKKYFLSNLNM